MYRIFILLSIAILCGCGPSQPDRAEDREVTDGLGRTVTMPAELGRVITLAPSLTEIVFAAGAGDRLVAVTTADDFPPEVERLTKISAVPVNFEAILSMQPDLVLATDQVNSPSDGEKLASLGIPSYFFRFSTLDEVFDAILSVGALMRTTQVASHAVDSLRTRYQRVVRRSSRETRPSVIFLIGDQTPYAFGGESYVHDIIRDAGGESLTAEFEGATAILSDEYVLSRRPEIILGSFGEDFTPESLLRHHPTWRITPALENGNVFSIDGSIILRPGPRLVEAAERISEIIEEVLHRSNGAS